MPFADCGAVRIYYDTFGSPDDPAILLIMGLGGQAIAWDVGFCEQLAADGFFVIRFDNRDAGLSTHLEDQPVNAIAVVAAAMAGMEVSVPYTVSDMAADAVALLDHLGIARAHLVGVSMGGMIAQTAAAEYPGRVASLTSIMSSTGNREVGQPSPEALHVLTQPPPVTRQEVIERSVQDQLVIGSSVHIDEEYTRARAAEAFDRCYYPAGTARQLAAIFASGDRSHLVSRIEAPTLVIHGAEDSLIHMSGGEHTAELVPDAELVILEDMGHDIPRPLWPTIITAITEHVRAAMR